jgi:rRNA processing protein Krr1/Pno1
MAIVESACLGLFNEVKTALANKPDSVSIEHLVNEKDPFGDTALHYACLKGNLLLVRFLISQGADVNIQNEAGSTPLHKAVLSGSKAVVSFLLEHKAELEIKNLSGNFPDDLAREHAELHHFLIEKVGTTETIQVPKTRHGVLIGKKGKAREEIRFTTGVDVVVPNERDNSETIKLVGRKKNIDAAKERIDKMIETNVKLNANDAENTSNSGGRGGANNNSNNTFDTVVKMSIPADKYRQLAQRQSPALKKIYAQTGRSVNIILPDADDVGSDKEVKIKIEGSIEAINDAMKVIKKFVAGAPERQQRNAQPRREREGINFTDNYAFGDEDDREYRSGRRNESNNVNIMDFLVNNKSPAGTKRQAPVGRGGGSAKGPAPGNKKSQAKK